LGGCFWQALSDLSLFCIRWMFWSKVGTGISLLYAAARRIKR
jgi:hypothetical protein